MNSSINFTSLVISPIATFSDHISKHLAQVIDDYISGILEIGKCDWAIVERFTKEINDLEQNIEVHRKTLKIKWRKFVNGLLVFFSILLIGLIFLPIYFRNRSIIAQFETETAQKRFRINDLINRRFKLITNALSNATFRDAYKGVFAAFGIFGFDYLPYSALYSIISRSYNDVVFLAGMGGLIKNSPFYDLIFYQREFRDVVTSNSLTFEYTVRIGDHNVTRHEKLWACHHEKTPFIEPHSGLVYYTNFDQELIFQTNNHRYDKELWLENKLFIKMYRIVCKCENKAKLSEFFTIKAQEDFVDWKHHESNVVPTFCKNGNYLIVWNDFGIDPKLELINFPLSSFMFEHFKTKIDPLHGLNQIHKTINQYFERLTKLLQLPLLVPGISREWYKRGGQYLIANSGSSDRNYYATHSVNGECLISKFNTSPFISFLGDKQSKRRPWMSFQSAEQVHRCTVNKVFWNSYWSQILVDKITVYGKHVGKQVIPVNYEKFYELKEEKLIISAPALLKDDDVVISSQLFKCFVNDQAYENEELTNFVLENALWTNHPERLEKIITQGIFELVEKITIFRHRNRSFNSNVHLIFDQAQTYLIFNKTENLSDEFLQSILSAIEWSLDKPKTKPFMRNV